MSDTVPLGVVPPMYQVVGPVRVMLPKILSPIQQCTDEHLTITIASLQAIAMS
jgi:hypothetical protein